jgi:hypothetical protein
LDIGKGCEGVKGSGERLRGIRLSVSLFYGSKSGACPTARAVVSISAVFHSEDGFPGGSLDTAFQLTLVSATVEMALRLGNESIVSELPHFEAADANPATGATWSGVGADECPMVDSPLLLQEDLPHKYLQIWERGHECLRSLCDGSTADRRSAIVNG